MPSLEFKTSYKKNTGLLLSVEELKALYFYGVGISSSDGTKFSDEAVEMYIRQAQEEIEKFLSIKLIVQLMTETHSYHRDDYMNGFPIIQTNIQVNTPLTCIGKINGTEQIIFPESWLTAASSSDGRYSKRISIVPTGSVAVEGSGDVLLAGLYEQIGILSFKNIPDYYTTQYKTGYDTIPMDIMNVVGMLAAIPMFAIAGDLILGAGVASTSLSIDNLSQSISSTSSATNSGYGARIIEYRKSIDSTLKRLKSYYSEIRFAVC